MKFRTNYQRFEKQSIVFNDASRTKQSMKDECDINNIVRGIERGVPPPLARGEAQYADVSDPVDYQAAIQIVKDAEEQFASLGSRVRERFQNNPQAFLEFTHNADNIEEMVKLGLIRPEAVERVTAEKAARKEKLKAKKEPKAPAAKAD